MPISKFVVVLGIEKSIGKAKEGIGSKMIHKEEAKRGKQGIVRPHGPLMRLQVSLGAFRDEVCPDPYDRTVYSCARAGTKSKLHVLLTVHLHGVSRDRMVPFGRIKIKAKIGIKFLSQGQAPLKAKFGLYEEGTAETQATNFH
ncbi:hypothetical protein PIB30_078397 [Stylosanthes scabra]|uniref:Uncharacterized protein n=1 Tax=Stylosanthes scabra TaxID=79078 RepID=A0ABU6RR34_9FABA|nr:hypothetical protein [Stylosanthes scabra]